MKVVLCLMALFSVVLCEEVDKRFIADSFHDLVDQVGDLASGLADGASDLLEGASDLASDLVDKLLGEVPDGLDIVVDLLKIGLQADDVCDTACPLVLLAAGYTDLTPLCSMGCGLLDKK